MKKFADVALWLAFTLSALALVATLAHPFVSL